MIQVPRITRGAMAALAVVAILTGVSISVVMAGGREPTSGPIPPEAVENGAFNKALIPDFIPALDRNGQIAGYVARDLAIPDGAPVNAPIPVYGDDLKTIVGYMHPGRGFVPLGVSVDSAPVIPATVGGDSANTP